MSDWTIRDSVPEDESALASMWLKAYANSSDALWDFPGANERATPAEVAYWRAYQPIVTALLRSADVQVLCDPERATYEGGKRAVIWAWACTLDDRVFWASVKRAVVRADVDLARDMVRALLGPQLAAPCEAEFHQMDLHRLGLVPETWKTVHDWRRAMLGMSAAVLEGDVLTAVVGAHILDPARPVWKPEAA
jgi:hypothetical protein